MKTNFDEKLGKINSKVTSNKTKHVEVGKVLTDHITFYTKRVNTLSTEVKLISTKGLTKDLTNGYSMLNDAKYFSEDGSQSYFVFQPLYTSILK